MKLTSLHILILSSISILGGCGMDGAAHWDPPSQIMDAIYREDRNGLAQLVATSRESLDAVHVYTPDPFLVGKHTPLTLCTYVNFVDGIDLLVDAGATVNPQGKRFITPLFEAVSNRRLAIVKALLRRGADPEQIDPIHGETPLAWSRGIAYPEIQECLETTVAAKRK